MLTNPGFDTIRADVATVTGPLTRNIVVAYPRTGLNEAVVTEGTSTTLTFTVAPAYDDFDALEAV